MASRRDLIQSYSFAARRVVSAVVMRESDPAEWPMRRLGGAGFAAVMLTVIALAAVAIYGFIVPGGATSWQDGRSIVVEKETGTRFVYVDGRLHPVRNFASAALLVGSTAVTHVARASLTGVPRGVELGIEGAPDALPAAADLVGTPWSLCTEEERDRAGVPRPRAVLAVGRRPEGGDAVGERALLVTASGAGPYLIWRDQRYAVADLNTVSVALGLDGEVAVPVSDAWLAALPAGRPIAPIRLAGTGTPSQALTGVAVGQVVVVPAADGARSYYLADAALLVPISPLQAQLQLAVAGSPPERPVAPSAVAGAPKARPAAAAAEDPPVQRPDFLRPAVDTAVCAVYRDGAFAPTVLLGGVVAADALTISEPAGSGGIETGGVSATGVPLANRVVVPSGRGALVMALPSPRAASASLYLVTDLGLRFAVPTMDVAHALGYGAGAPVSNLPTSLLVRIPEGPPLDPAAARAALVNQGGAAVTGQSGP